MSEENRPNSPHPDLPGPVEHKPDTLSTEEAMKSWRRISNDAVALARTLMVASASGEEHASLFIDAARRAGDQIIVNELARLYEIEKSYDALRYQAELADNMITNLRERLEKAARKKETKQAQKK